MLVRKKMKKWASARQKYPRGCICGTWSLRCKDCVTSIWVYFSVQLVPSFLASFHQKYSIQNTIDSSSCKNIAQARERWHLENAVAAYEKAGGWARQQDTGKLAKNIKIICLQTPIWKVSCHRSIISGLLGSFNGKWQGFSMVWSKSELRLVELFTFPG